MRFDELTDEEWMSVSTLITDEPARLNRRGRPRAENRVVANAVLWILSVGEPWSKLPGRYPSGPTCRRRFEDWLTSGVLGQMIKLLAEISGRTFAYIPPPPAAQSAISVCGPEILPDVDRLRGIFWQNPASWQLPATQETKWRDNRVFETDVQFPADKIISERIEFSCSASVAPGVSVLPYDNRKARMRAISVSFAATAVRRETYHSYTIDAIAQPVNDLMFRAWAEIVQSGERIERSGLIGPRFIRAGEAQQYAFEWACQWIELSDVNKDLVPVQQASVPAPTAPEASIKRCTVERQPPQAESRNDSISTDCYEYEC